MPVQQDVVIVGGGPVGACLAALLADSGLSVTLLEARGADADDPRRIALSYGSAVLLQKLGAWVRIDPCTPIETIHVSQSGGWGRALLRAEEIGVPALGYVVSYGSCHAALTAAMAQAAGVSVRHGVRAEHVTATADAAEVTLRSEAGSEILRARLAVLADGGQVSAATAPRHEHDYRQSAVVADVVTDRAHDGRAYERFCPTGPIALLPSQPGYALVWTTRADHAAQLVQLAPAQFLAALQSAFGERAGRFVATGAPALFPLQVRVAAAPATSRMVLLGNAAQTLHPVAGQGLNLGLRDAAVLAEMIAAQPGTLDDPGLPRRFHMARRADRTLTAGITHGLVRTFSNDLAPLRALRGCGLTLLDVLPSAKRAFARRMTFGT